ncbi:MAG: GxxExxY protein [Verrucomicrobia bacterium]|nr:GxxExxY protein [Verrucomicrobiota bacterium]
MALLHENLSGRILGCCLAVHRTLGPGFVESIYEAAVCLELGKAGLAFERQKEVVIRYDGVEIGRHRLDLSVEDQVVVELKAANAIEDVFLARAKSYLKAASRELALVVNFARPTLEVKRVILTNR